MAALNCGITFPAFRPTSEGNLKDRDKVAGEARREEMALGEKHSSHRFWEGATVALTSPHTMASVIQRSSKRLRLSPSNAGWICRDCRRSFAASVQTQIQQQQQQQQPSTQDGRTTHFGFQTVAEEQKASRGTHQSAVIYLHIV